MKTLFMTAILALSFSSLSAFAVETKNDDGKICFNDKRVNTKNVNQSQKQKKLRAQQFLKTKLKYEYNVA